MKNLTNVAGMRIEAGEIGDKRREAASRNAADAQLMSRVATGDERAFESVHARYCGAVLALGLKWLRNRAAAEDLVQEVFLNVWRRAAHFDPARASLITWIMMVARGRAIDRLRRNRTESVRAEPAFEFEPYDRAPRFSSEESAIVARAMRTLPDEQRTVITLAFGKSLTRTQIAHSAGVPVGTVKTQIHRGVVALRHEIERCCAA